jgi:transposase InsO family protein
MGSYTKEKRLIRYAVVASVLAKEEAGMTMSAAIAETMQLVFREGGNGRVFHFRKRSVYRWVAAFRKAGFDGLADQKRIRRCYALSKAFLDFLKEQKNNDEEISIPDVIRAAELLGIAEPGEVSRTTAWRAARQLNLPLLGTRAKESSTKRRFAFAHRMQMVLCDGKHFRAGLNKRKRVAFTFLDDATRKVLAAVVGRSETKVLFLRGLYKTVLRYGIMRCIYVDHGSGFIPEDVEVVCARLGIALIHGRERYPEGHGKIERYHQTFGKDLLRTFPGDPAIDPSPSSLELHIEHYACHCYNRTKHESLEQKPDEKWNTDSAPLKPIDDISGFELKFVVSKVRKVSSDNIVKVDGKNLEMPVGYAGKQVVIEQNFIDGKSRVLHQGRMIDLSPANLAENAASHRARSTPRPKKALKPVRTAARISFEQSFESLVSKTGDCFDHQEKE